MGGYGTLLYAVHHPDLFSAAFAMSPAASVGQRRPERRPDTSDEQFAAMTKWAENNDVIAYLDSLADKKAVRFMIDCGDDDFCLPGAWDFFQKARKLGVPCELRIRDGVHSWDYWRVSLPMALDFISNK
jgi:S-formylglutathione hydrolase FrmB